MKKWSNKTNMPQPMATAIMNDEYSLHGADISITGLLSPPRQRVLQKIHKDKIVEDVSDRLDSLLGQAIHTILERANQTALAEEIFLMEVDGVKIKGQCDAVYVAGTGLIQDYKTTSINAVMFGNKPEWEAQLNCYAYMVEFKIGKKVEKLEIVAIFKDWSKRQARREKKDSKYPKKGFAVIDIPVWTNEQTLTFIRQRLELHKQANKKLPLCTTEERWAKPDKWAVMIKGRKTSVKNHDQEMFAVQHASDVGGKVEHRPAENPRCEDYCNVNFACSQFKLLQKRLKK